MLKKYNQISKKVEKLLRIELIVNFQGKKMPKEKVPCKSLWIIMLDSVVKAKKKYYLQTLLAECKYELKIKMESLFDDELEKSSSDESHNDSNDETEFDDEKDNDESNK